MVLTYLTTARDIGLILLAAEFILLGAVPLLALFYANRALRSAFPSIARGLRAAHGHLQRFNKGVGRVTRQMQAPFLWVTSAALKTRSLVSGVRRGMRRRRVS